MPGDRNRSEIDREMCYSPSDKKFKNGIMNSLSSELIDHKYGTNLWGLSLCPCILHLDLAGTLQNPSWRPLQSGATAAPPQLSGWLWVTLRRNCAMFHWILNKNWLLPISEELWPDRWAGIHYWQWATPVSTGPPGSSNTQSLAWSPLASLRPS